MPVPASSFLPLSSQLSPGVAATRSGRQGAPLEAHVNTSRQVFVVARPGLKANVQKNAGILLLDPKSAVLHNRQTIAP